MNVTGLNGFGNALWSTISDGILSWSSISKDGVVFQVMLSKCHPSAVCAGLDSKVKRRYTVSKPVPVQLSKFKSSEIKFPCHPEYVAIMSQFIESTDAST